MNESLATADCPDRARSSPADVSSAESCSPILIIEDEALVAQSLADLVSDAGFLALGPVATAAEAVRVLDRCRPHAAILDIVLRDGMATRVAIELASRSIPFIVYSGLPPGGVSLPELARMRWHEKPASGDELISSLAELIGEDVRLGPRTLEVGG
jgi:DNA-binding response OmpR family regulator